MKETIRNLLIVICVLSLIPVMFFPNFFADLFARKVAIPVTPSRSPNQLARLESQLNVDKFRLEMMLDDDPNKIAEVSGLRIPIWLNYRNAAYKAFDTMNTPVNGWDSTIDRARSGTVTIGVRVDRKRVSHYSVKSVKAHIDPIGSGFVHQVDGGVYIVTNAHVITEQEDIVSRRIWREKGKKSSDYRYYFRPNVLPDGMSGDDYREYLHVWFPLPREVTYYDISKDLAAFRAEKIEGSVFGYRPTKRTKMILNDDYKYSTYPIWIEAKMAKRSISFPPRWAIPLAPDGSRKIGMPVVAIGSPGGKIDVPARASPGIITALKVLPEYQGYEDDIGGIRFMDSRIYAQPGVFSASTPVLGGNSGGPVINTDGELVGIVFAAVNSTYPLTYGLSSESLRELFKPDSGAKKYGQLPLPEHLADGKGANALYTFGYALWLKDIGHKRGSDKHFDKLIAAGAAGAGVYAIVAKLLRKEGSPSQEEKNRILRELNRLESQTLRKAPVKNGRGIRKVFSQLRRFVKFL